MSDTAFEKWWIPWLPFAPWMKLERDTIEIFFPGTVKHLDEELYIAI